MSIHMYQFKGRVHSKGVARFKKAFVFGGMVSGGALVGYYGKALQSSVTKWIAEKVGNNSATDQTTYHQLESVALVGMIVLGAVLGAWVCGLFLDFCEYWAERWDRMGKGERFTLMLSVIVGILISLPFMLVVNSTGTPYAPTIMVCLSLGLIVVAVYMVQTVSEFLPWSKEASAGKRSGIKILDTNVLIDGRIYDVARSGFLEGQLYVPNWVLEELQHIADHHDALRRQRGRRGLDMLRHLQLDFPVEVGTKDKLIQEMGDPVDSRLVRLAKVLGADIVTNDFNLNKVAGIQEVRVLSLNDLTLALRPNVLPQEKLNLLISREGKEYGQGVGYLEDGTMVVVENGKSVVGVEATVTVTQVIQTERGKMIFAEFTEDLEAEAKKRGAKAPK